MKNLTNFIDPKVEYLFATSKEILFSDYWNMIDILNNLSEDDFGSVHYALNDYYPGLINYYIEKSKFHFNSKSDISGIPTDQEVSKISRLYLARLYALKSNDFLKHYIEVDYSEKLQSLINYFIHNLSKATSTLLAKNNKKIIKIFSKLSFINFCKAFALLDKSVEGITVHCFLESDYNCYTNNINSFDEEDINYVYACEILIQRINLLQENALLHNIFSHARTQLIQKLIGEKLSLAQNLLEKHKLKTIMELHIESELEIFMSFANQEEDLIEDMKEIMCQINKSNE